MLQSLYIQNYALIEQLSIPFYKGFSVITGETGAGKSILLGAINLLLGQRADSKAIRVGADKCIIEAIFNIGDYDLKSFFEENELDYLEECILRREVSITGKSRAFINDTPVNLAQMRLLGDRLIDIHSQHQNLLLSQESFQMDIIDVMADNSELLKVYQNIYTDWQKKIKELTQLIQEAEEIREKQDYIQFQLEQLEEANLVKEELVQLEKDHELQTHAEEIKETLYKLESLLDNDEGGAISLLNDSIRWISDINKVFSPAEELSERLNSVYIELKDILREIRKEEEQVEFNPVELERIQNRLSLIYSLQQKHNVQTVEELIKLKEDYQDQLNAIFLLDDKTVKLKEAISLCFKAVKEKAKELTDRRLKASHLFEKEITNLLIPLGMKNVQFLVDFEKRKEPNQWGEDLITFRFSANKNSPLQPLSMVASGGEIARVMLSIKAMIAGKIHLPTLVFDEIDTGVSGEIAERMAIIMEEMSKNDRQVISITHLPQIAALGKTHYKVYKKDDDHQTNSHISKLEKKERIEEIAQMVSGSTLTQAALDNAKALLGLS
ncbi:MAG: DNA repair protein RecN [Bacteroidales bacterium]|nr:DNA repair protein RecN [Bacteroidales bacterium]